jgi:spermidine synthase
MPGSCWRAFLDACLPGFAMFIAGAALMCFEISGGQVITSHFGSSAPVWGAILTAFLSVMGLGYLFGSLLAVRKTGAFSLSLLFGLTGLFSMVMARLGHGVCRFFLGLTDSIFFVPYLSFGSALSLFSVPVLLLGMVSPVTVQIAVRRLSETGRTVGRLYALNAAGSLAGALAVTFIFNFRYGNRTVMAACGLCLIFLSGIIMLWVRRREKITWDLNPYPPQQKTSEAGLRTILFLAGTVLMSLEVVGGLHLAPYYGNTVFLWGNIISIFLGAMTGGYYLGGYIADRWSGRQLPGILSIIAGLTIVFIPLITPYAGRAVNVILISNIARIFRPFCLAAVLFGIPVILLSMVTPLAVRIASGTNSAGFIAGRFYALSTMGNVAGLAVTTFLLVSRIGKTQLFGWAGFSMVMIGIVVMLCVKQIAKSKTFIAVSAGIVTLTLAGIFLPKPPLVAMADQDEMIAGKTGAWTIIQLRENPDCAMLRRLVQEKESPYHHVSVIDEKAVPVPKTVVTHAGNKIDVFFSTVYGNRRLLKFDNTIQSAVGLSETADSLRVPYQSGMELTAMLHIPFIVKPGMKDVLIIGGGGGIMPMVLKNTYPVMIDVVELDPVVVQVACRWFGLMADDRLRVHTMDGRMFLYHSRKQYDLIILDTYSGGGKIPFHLTTREFLELVRGHLKPHGAVFMNLISAVKGPRSRLFRAVFKTFRGVFGLDQLVVFPAVQTEDQSPQEKSNIFIGVLTPDNDKQLRIEALFNLLAGRREENGLTSRYAAHMLMESDLASIATEDVPLLTDDYAPVDMLTGGF